MHSTQLYITNENKPNGNNGKSATKGKSVMDEKNIVLHWAFNFTIYFVMQCTSSRVLTQTSLIK